MKYTDATERQPQPKFLRMPPSGTTEPTTGLKRGYLYRLAREGKIPTVTLKEKGAKRGVTLIEAESLYRYLEAHMDYGRTGSEHDH